MAGGTIPERIRLGVFAVPEDVPVRTILEAGVPIALGADDPLLFGTRLTDQYRIAREVPTFRPQWTLRKGIEQLAEAYQRHRLTLEALMGERHQRLKHITALQKAGRLDGSLRWTEAA